MLMHARVPQTHTGAEVGKAEADAKGGEVWVHDGVVVDVVVVADADRGVVRSRGLKRVDGFLHSQQSRKQDNASRIAR